MKTPKIDINQTLKFLEELGFKKDAKIFFQTFDDNKDRNDKGLTRCFSDTFENVKNQLIELNMKGAGVFICPNLWNGSKTLTKNSITGINTIFIDKDDGPLNKKEITPSIVVSTKKGEHGYFKIDPSDSNKLTEYESLASTLINFFEADRSTKNINRLGRLPGFLHNKNPNEPFLVVLKYTTKKIYKFDDLNCMLRSSPHSVAIIDAKTANWISSLPVEEGARNDSLMKMVRSLLSKGQPPETVEMIAKLYQQASGLPQEEVNSLLERHFAENEKTPFVTFTDAEAPLMLAEDYIESISGENGSGKLVYWNQYFYRFTGSHYVLVSDDEMKCLVIRFLQKQSFSAPKKAIRKWTEEVIANLKGQLFLSSEVKPNSWIDNSMENHPRCISMKNGLYNIDAFLKGETKVLLPHSPSYFSFFSLPYDYDPEASCPKWDEFLLEMIPDIDEKKLLQNWIGYQCIDDTSMEKFMILVGSGANGKSVICNVMTELIGEENITNLGLESFSQKRTFPLAQTVGKLSNISTDMNEVKKANEGVLKQITSGEPMLVENKNKTPFKMEPSIRMTFSTNVFPRFTDRSSGLWRRMIVLELKKQILDESKQDKRLASGKWWRESAMMPGVFNWAMMGLKDLLERGYFVIPKSVETNIERFKMECNPAATFLSENFYQDFVGSIPATYVYKRYCEWCRARGYYPLTQHNLSNELKQQFPQVTSSKTAKMYNNPKWGKDRCRRWEGLAEIESDELVESEHSELKNDASEVLPFYQEQPKNVEGIDNVGNEDIVN